MTSMNVPQSLKSLTAYVKTANEMEKRDPVVSYYCRLYSVQRGMELDKKSPEGKKFLMELMDKLDKTKTEFKENESISSEVVGQAHVEEYALRLFAYADSKDREGDFGQPTVSSFITAGYLMDVLAVFGVVGEDIEKCRKYAKWKAVYINQCLKRGEVPHCGPLDDHDEIANANDMFPIQPVVQQPVPLPRTAKQTPPNPGVTAATSNINEPKPVPKVSPAATVADKTPTSSSGNLSAEDFAQAEKYCRYATSALQYQDAGTAINYLTQCLDLLTRSGGGGGAKK